MIDRLEDRFSYTWMIQLQIPDSPFHWPNLHSLSVPVIRTTLVVASPQWMEMGSSLSQDLFHRDNSSRPSANNVAVSDFWQLSVIPRPPSAFRMLEYTTRSCRIGMTWQPIRVTSLHEIPIFTIPTFWRNCGMPERIQFRWTRLMCIKLDNNLVPVQRVRTSLLRIVPGLMRGLAGWANNATGGPVEGPILVDGAKRDRWGILIFLFASVNKTSIEISGQVRCSVWSWSFSYTYIGDMGISSHTELVALNDILSSKNALLVMFSTQGPATGALQYSGPPINAKGSDTYISWSLIGAHNVWLYTGDLEFVRTVWTNYTKALAFLEVQVDETGLMNVPESFSNDWGRDGGQGYNIAANVLLYRVSNCETSRSACDDFLTVFDCSVRACKPCGRWRYVCYLYSRRRAVEEDDQRCAMGWWSGDVSWQRVQLTAPTGWELDGYFIQYHPIAGAE